MPKDYAKFVPPKSGSSHPTTSRVGIALFASFVLMLSIAISYFIYEKKVAHIPGEKPSFSGFLSYAASSVFHHHPKLAVLHVKNKQSSSNKPLPGVEFDFYHDLPSMQMSVAEDDKTKATTVKIAASADELAPKDDSQLSAPTQVGHPEQMAAAQEKASSQEAPHAVAAPVTQELAAESAEAPSTAASAQLVSEEDVSKQLREEVTKQLTKKQAVPAALQDEHIAAVEVPSEEKANASVSSRHYVLQLGEFETRSGAERLQEALSSAGFDTQILEKKSNNQAEFIVQQGPFDSKDIAQASQQRLQKRGIITVLRQSEL